MVAEKSFKQHCIENFVKSNKKEKQLTNEEIRNLEYPPNPYERDCKWCGRRIPMKRMSTIRTFFCSRKCVSEAHYKNIHAKNFNSYSSLYPYKEWFRYKYWNEEWSIHEMGYYLKEKWGRIPDIYRLFKAFNISCRKKKESTNTEKYKEKASKIRRKYCIKDLREFAIKKGGKCLSIEYINNNTKYKWECSKGHIWKSKWRVIKRIDNWCPYCFNKGKAKIEEMQEIAKNHGGKCLSNKYITARSNLKWQCEKGHIWDAAPTNIKRGKWCPYCLYKTQEKVRKIFERLFNAKFSLKRPKWLKTNVNGRLELDGYNEKLKIAFEYNGIQHYERINVWHKKEEDFEKLLLHDKIKKEICKKHRIDLIVIPYIEKDNLEEYIIGELNKKNLLKRRNNKKYRSPLVL